MATARELLEQVDALMRRNRLRDAAAASAASDIPLLTDVVAADEGEPGGAAVPAAPPALRLGADKPEPAPPSGDGTQSADAGDVPILTEVAADLEPIPIRGDRDDTPAAAPWPDFDDGETSAGEAPEDAGDAAVAGPLPDTFAEAPAVSDAVGAAPIVPDAIEAAQPFSGTTDAAPVPVVPPGDRAADVARWDALAEEVRMQVLQRIDIFTDTGLQEQLGARLQPIVDRASADLVATINQQVGQLLRAYVAEAIEREIEKWRGDDAP